MFGLLHSTKSDFSLVRNDNFNHVHAFSYALKNNFAILINKGLQPLVLTSITFDSLSRKIKNPCLVIKKNLYQKEIFKMKILKTKKLFTYMVVGALVMALSISCKNEDKTGSGDGNSFNLDDIPTVSGNAATFFTGSYTFTGTLARQSFEGISEEEANSGTLPASMQITVTINANKITVNYESSSIQDAQLNNYSENTYTSGIYIAGVDSQVDGMHNKEYIQIRLLDANGSLASESEVQESSVNKIMVYYQLGSIQNFDGQTYNFKGTYSGSLAK